MPITRLRSASDLREEFRAYGRQSAFSSQAFEWLWDYLEQYEEDTCTPLEIDVVGLCCDYSEEDYGSIASSYSVGLPEREDFEYIDFPGNMPQYDEEAHTEAKREAILDYLRDNTVVLGYDDDSVLFAAF